MKALNLKRNLQNIAECEDVELFRKSLSLFVVQLFFYINSTVLPVLIFDDYIKKSGFHTSGTAFFISILYWICAVIISKGYWKSGIMIPLSGIFIVGTLAQLFDGPNTSLLILYLMFLIIIQILFRRTYVILGFLFSLMSYFLVHYFRPDQINFSYLPSPYLCDYLAFTCMFVCLCTMALFVYIHSSLNHKLSMNAASLKKKLMLDKGQKKNSHK
jgi:hypothetical protein